MTNTRTTIEEISHARKVARWALHESAIDLRFVAASLTTESVSAPWQDLVQASTELLSGANFLMGQAVSVARANGASWADIAAITGGTRQGAQQKYSH